MKLIIIKMQSELTMLLIKEAYGEEYLEICQLLKSGQSIDQLLKLTNFSYDRIREILTILLTNNYVQHNEQQFLLNQKQIVDQINHPLYYDYIFQNHGEICAQISKIFFEVSQLTLKNCIKILEKQFSQQEIQDNFILLIEKNLIVQIEQINFIDDEEPKVQKKVKNQDVQIYFQQNDNEHLFVDSVTNEEIYYKINSSRFIQKFRFKKISEIVCQKISLQCANIIQAILKNSNKLKQSYIDKISEPVLLEDIQNNLPSNINIKSDEILLFILKLKKEQYVVEYQMNNNTLYGCNIEKIVKTLQIKLVEKIIEYKYGVNQSRILRILKMHRALDEKKISESALMSIKDCRAVLLQLYQDQLIQIDTLKNEQQQNISVYSLDIPNLFEKNIWLLQKTIYNLKIQQEMHIKNIQNLDDDFDQVQLKQFQQQILKIESAILEVQKELIQLESF